MPPQATATIAAQADSYESKLAEMYQALLIFWELVCYYFLPGLAVGIVLVCLFWIYLKIRGRRKRRLRSLMIIDQPLGKVVFSKRAIQDYIQATLSAYPQITVREVTIKPRRKRYDIAIFADVATHTQLTEDAAAMQEAVASDLRELTGVTRSLTVHLHINRGDRSLPDN